MIIYQLKDYLSFAHHHPKTFCLNILKAGEILSFRYIYVILKELKFKLDICMRKNKEGGQAKNFDLKTMF